MPQQPPPVPPFTPEDLVGEVLDGRYRLVAHLATGGMGAVFRAEHVYMKKDLAVKVLRPDLSAASDIVERFRREAEIAAGLEHENIVRVTDFGKTPEGYLFLAMELLEGESLFDRLRRVGPMDPREAVSILAQVCSALAAAHARAVVHRDLKPENVFLTAAPDGRTVAKILDFGIAKITDGAGGGWLRRPAGEEHGAEHERPSATQAGLVVGTPEYLSPEQALGLEVDARADLYGVGIMAWRMLAGRHPFKADDARQLLMMQATRTVPPIADPRPDLAAYPALLAAVAKACAKDPKERPQTADELKRLFEQSLEGAPPLVPVAAPPPSVDRMPQVSPLPFAAPPAPPPERPRELARRAGMRLARAAATARAHPLSFALGAAALAVLLVLGGVAVHRRDLPESRAERLIEAGHPDPARDILERELEARKDDPRLWLLLGRAQHRLPRKAGDGIASYEKAYQLDKGALRDRAALADLAQDLGREQRLADRAAKLLVAVGDPAVPAVADQARHGHGGTGRLRALRLIEALKASDKLDRVAAYEDLLKDPDCEVRKSAALALGELGDPRAVPKLREAAAVRPPPGPLPFLPSVDCGAAQAAASSVKRIEGVASRKN